MTIDLQNNYIWGIPPYAFWIGIGLSCSVILFFYLLYDNEIKIDKQPLIYVCGIVGVIVGAKLFGVIKNFLLTLYNQEPLTVEILGSAGLVFYGGLLGFLLCTSIAIFWMYRRFDMALINLIVITIPLFHGFGRIGCLFAGCCFGAEYTDFLSVTYIQSPQEIRSCFPTQLVESIFEFAIFITLFIVHKKNKEKNLLKIYLATYAVFRFALEFMRGDTIRGLFGQLSFSQYISLLILTILLLLTIIHNARNVRRFKNENC